MRTLLAAGVAFYLLGFAPHLAPAHSQPRDGQLQRLTATPSASQDSSQAPRDAERAPTPNSGGAQAEAISLPQIADRAQELNQLLREITSQLTPKTELFNANQMAEAQTTEIRERALEAKDLMADNPTPMELEDEQRYWLSLSQEYRARRKLLVALAVKLQQEI